jgi:hypothetical protein
MVVLPPSLLTECVPLDKVRIGPAGPAKQAGIDGHGGGAPCAPVAFSHLEVEREPFDHIPPAGSRLLHVHVADTGRLHPGVGSYDYMGFYRALRKAGYDARISIECNWCDFLREIAPAMRFVRQSWEGSLSAG